MDPKTCRTCGNEFTPRDACDARARKFCSHKCYTDAKRVKLKAKTCKTCGKKFEHYPHRTGVRFCSMACFYQDSKKSRLGKKNPNFRGGIWAKGGSHEHGSKTAGIHLRACAKYKRQFIEKHGYAFCEVCRVSNAYRYSTHHLYYASRYPKHEHLHDDRNLILLCEECHRKFHASEMQEVFAKLETARGLKELFSAEKRLS